MNDAQRAATLAIVASFAVALSGCVLYEAFEGRISNHTATAHWYAISVNSTGPGGRELYWNKSLPVGDYGTSFLGQVGKHNGNYTLRVIIDNETTVRSERSFHHNEGPWFFQVTTRSTETTIEYGFR